MNQKSIARSRASRMLAATTAAGLLLSLAACSSGASPSNEGGSDGSTAQKLSVGLFTAADVAPVFLAEEQGFFEEEGLEVDTQMLESGAAVVAAVIAGDVQIGFSNPASVVTASGQGLPVSIVAPASEAGKNSDEAYAAVIAPVDSDIQSTKDLEGKSVAVNAVGNILELTLNRAMQEADGDPSKVRLVEVPFPEMPAMLEQGQVDAAFMVEPFLTQSLESGVGRIVATPYEETAPSLTGAVYFSTQQFVAEDPETVAAFRRAMQKAVEYAGEHPDELRQSVAGFTKIDPEVVDRMRFAGLSTDVPREMIELYVEMAEDLELVKPGSVDIDKLMSGLDAK